MTRKDCCNRTIILVLFIFVVAGTRCRADSGTLTGITPVSVPGNNATFASGINNLGQIAGSYRFAASGAPEEGFLDNNGIFSIIAFPGATETGVQGLNNSGQVVGAYFSSGDSFKAFVDTNGSFNALSIPNAVSSAAYGISDSGQIVGYFTDTSGVQHGFICSGITCNPINVPGATNTDALAINNEGQITGWYSNASGTFSFIYDLSSQTFTTFGAPGSTDTLATGINDLGQVVAYDFSSERSLIYSDFSTTFYTVPNFPQTRLFGINDGDQVVGTLIFGDSFSAQVPESSTLPLLGAGLIVLACLSRRIRKKSAPHTQLQKKCLFAPRSSRRGDLQIFCLSPFPQRRLE